MNIDIPITTPKNTFNDLKNGYVFQFQRALFMKIEILTLGHGEVRRNAVVLATGNACYFSDSVEVISVPNAVLRVNDGD